MSLSVLVAPADRFACGHVRYRWPVAALAAQGFDVEILEPEDRGVSATLRRGRVISARFPECDVLCLQRPTSRTLVECIPLVQSTGTAVVVDFDDDLSNVNPNNAAFAGMHPARDPDNNWRWAEQAARVADLVTVSTPQLVDKYGSHGRVRVLRNCVPDHYLTTEPVGERWNGFGWAGALHSHPHDLQVLGPAAARLVRAGHPFHVVGPPVGVGRALGLEEDPDGSGLVEFPDWPGQVARLQVGVAPLVDTMFNRQKSAWKVLEMSALGVPWVASDLPEYRRFAELGAGVVAGRPKAWAEELAALLASEGLRAERAGRAKEVAASLAYSRQAHVWAEAWEQAAAARRAIVGRAPVPAPQPATSSIRLPPSGASRGSHPLRG